MRLLKIATTYDIEPLEVGMAWLNIVTGLAFLVQPGMFAVQASWQPLAWAPQWAVGLLLVAVGVCRMWCIEKCTTRLYLRAVFSFFSGFLWTGFAILQHSAGVAGIGWLLFGGGLAPLCMLICARNILDTRSERVRKEAGYGSR